ncbi:MAG TPA: hypothetical protein VG820_08290, partial [Fimbriimonadaceae bacterium]|nr:hypothetical protein [Fimbriimonadaceae bacterium]
MGLLDSAEEIGGAIVDGASSIAAGPVQAIHFAQAIAGKAESFVEDRLGPTGNAVIGMAASLIQAPLGFVPAAAHALGDFLSDPAGFVEHVVETAEGTATSALSAAQEVVDRLVKNGLAGVGVLFSGAVAGLKAIGRGLVAGVKFASAGIVEGFLQGLRIARSQAMSLLRFEAGLTKEMLVLRAKARLAALRLIAGRVQSLIARTTGAVTRLTIGAFNVARQKATALAVKVHTKATSVVMSV